MILLKTIVLWKMNGDNFSYLLMFYLLGAVFLTVPTQAEFTCSSLRDDHKCSKSITDNPDATDLFFSRIFFFRIYMRLSGAGIFTDYHLLGTVFQTD